MFTIDRLRAARMAGLGALLIGVLALVGDRLTLLDSAGTQQLVLVRPSIQPVPAASPSPAPGSLVPEPEQTDIEGSASGA